MSYEIKVGNLVRIIDSNNEIYEGYIFDVSDDELKIECADTIFKLGLHTLKSIILL